MAFKEAKHQSAYLKEGVYGEMGTGKTHTSVLIAIGLHQHLGLTGPVYFVDSEKGSDFHVKRFEAAGVKLEVDKTRVFSTLVADVASLTAGDILIIDSVSHFWTELMSAYKRKRGRTFLSLYDFGPIKEEWNRYSTLFVNKPIHIIECGRSSDITVTEVIEESNGEGREQIRKLGTRMAAEKNTAYEPDLLVEMERTMLRDGGKYEIHATVLKDRFDIIMGSTFTNPTFENFLPYIQSLNLGGEHVGVRVEEGGSESMFDSPDTSVGERRRQQIIAVEEINAIKAQYITTTARDKRLWETSLEVVFGTTSETAIADKHPGALRAARDVLRYLIPWEQELEDQPANVAQLRKLLRNEFEGWKEKEQGEQPGGGH